MSGAHTREQGCSPRLETLHEYHLWNCPCTLGSTKSGRAGTPASTVVGYKVVAQSQVMKYHELDVPEAKFSYNRGVAARKQPLLSHVVLQPQTDQIPRVARGPVRRVEPSLERPEPPRGRRRAEARRDEGAVRRARAAGVVWSSGN